MRSNLKRYEILQLVRTRARAPTCELLPIINIKNRQFIVKQGVGHLFIFRLRR